MMISLKSKYSITAVFLLALIFVLSCQSEDQEETPEPEQQSAITVKSLTISITDLRAFLATGTVTTEGDLDIIDKGICWSTDVNPTLADNKASAGVGIGAFEVAINGVNLNTDYFARTYARTADTLVYGNQLTFSTKISSGLEASAVTETSITLSGIISEELDPITKFSGICWDTIPNPTIQAKKNSPLSAGSFSTSITNLTPNTKYYFRTFNILESDTLYSPNINAVTIPRIGKTNVMESGAWFTIVNAAFDISQNGSEVISEKGFVISQESKPTVENATKIISTTSNATMYKGIGSLSESSTYYVRAFVTNSDTTIYSEQDTLQTVASKKIRYTINMASEPTEDQVSAYVRLTTNMNTAVTYYDEYTNCSKRVWVNYVPGVPTADANIEGWMRFGSNRSYMNVRTCLHELAHTVGIGTSSGFNNLMVDNKWTGAEGIKTVRELSGNPSATINRYGVHIGPYGLNYDSEGTSHQDFVNHCTLIESMRKDGL